MTVKHLYPSAIHCCVMSATLTMIAIPITEAFNVGAPFAPNNSYFPYSYLFYPGNYPAYLGYYAYPPSYPAPPDRAQVNTTSPANDIKSPPLLWHRETPPQHQDYLVYPPAPATYRASPSKPWLGGNVPWRGAPPPDAH